MKKQNSLFLKFNIFFLRAILRVIALIPIPLMQVFAVGIGKLVLLFPKSKMIGTAKINLNFCLPEYSMQKRNIILTQSIIRSIAIGCEMPYIFFRGYSKVTSHVTRTPGIEKVEAQINSRPNKGVLLLGPHIGNWEIAIIYISKKFKTNILYTPQKSTVFDEIVKSSRTRYGLNMIPADLAGIKEMYTALKRGEVVVMLTDQVPKGGRGAVQVPFFNKHAATMTLPTKLYEKFSPSIFMVACLSKGPGKGFHFLFDDSIVSNIEIAKNIPDVEDYFAYGCNLTYEKIIREYPDQYQWIYKRYKHSDWYSYP